MGPTGAVAQVLGVDAGLSALVLERLAPGTALPPSHEELAQAVVADLLQRLHISVGTESEFPAVAAQYPALEQNSVDDANHEQSALGKPEPAGLALLPRARAAAERLCATTTSQVLLHGDLIDKNLLLDGDRYRAVDPAPMTGDPCFDV